MILNNYRLRYPPVSNEITSTTRAMKNTILAAPAALAAIPPNPKNAAINATTKNMMDILNMI